MINWAQTLLKHPLDTQASRKINRHLQVGRVPAVRLVFQDQLLVIMMRN
jgi:hypothetical protein